MTRRHPLDGVSLVFGFAFTAAGLLFLAGQLDEALRLRWLWPVLLLVLGVGILLDVARRPSEDRPPPPTAPADPTAAEPAMAAEPAEPPAAAEPPAEAAEPPEPPAAQPAPPATTRTAELDPEPPPDPDR
jgi:hypothetical protein